MHNVTNLMDSNGIVDFSQYPGLMEVCDGVMLDIKSWNTQVHRRLTGSDNQMVLKNLELLWKTGKLMEVRIVCKSGASDPEDTIRGIAGYLKGELSFRLKLITFSPCGVRGWMSGMEPPSQDYMEEIQTRLGTIRLVKIAKQQKQCGKRQSG